jgi:hypothetical protein
MLRNDDDLEEGSADLFDGKQIREYLVFASGAFRRRRALIAAVVSGVMALAALAVAALPRTYHVEAKLLAQRSAVLAVRGDGQDAVAPTRGAVETIRRRDNLVALIEATDLVQHWREHRAPAQRLVDGLRALVHGEDDAEEQLDAMVERLEKRLNAWTNDTTVVIAIDWTDARMAARLVDVAQQNFLEARHAQEISALAESIAILESHANGLRADVDDAVTALEDLRGKRPSPQDAAASAPSPSGASAPRSSARRATGPSPELEQITATLGAKRRALEDLEELRRRRLAEAQMRLAEQRATYTEAHPLIIDLHQTIAALETPSPQIKALRAEVASLRTEQERLGGEGAGRVAAPEAASGSARLLPIPREIVRLDEELREDRDPAVVYARGKLRDAMDKYAALCDKVHASQIDLETAQAAFKYRYSVLTPAKIPKRPVKPSVSLILIASFVSAILGAAVVAVVADVRSGILVEPWQIERLLDRPILGEVVLPQLPRPREERAR